MIHCSVSATTLNILGANLKHSYPAGNSVNDGIEPEVCSLHYTSVDEAARLVDSLGMGAQLAKFDLESAYRIVPVHPDDRPLLGMAWKGCWYMDTTLPSGNQKN